MSVLQVLYSTVVLVYPVSQVEISIPVPFFYSFFVDCTCLDSFRSQGGLLANDFVVGATAGISGSSVLLGYTNVNSSVVRSVSTQWMAAKLESNGTLKWRSQVHRMSSQTMAPRQCRMNTKYLCVHATVSQNSVFSVQSHRTRSSSPG